MRYGVGASPTQGRGANASGHYWASPQSDAQATVRADNRVQHTPTFIWPTLPLQRLDLPPHPNSGSVPASPERLGAS